MKKSYTQNTPQKETKKVNKTKLDLFKLKNIDKEENIDQEVIEIFELAGQDFGTFKKMLDHKKNVSEKQQENLVKIVLFCGYNIFIERIRNKSVAEKSQFGEIYLL